MAKRNNGKRLKAKVRVSYPADQRSYNTILKAGGLRHMDEEQKAALNMKTALPGESCDDLLPCHRDHFLRIGAIEEVDPPAKAKTAKKKTKKKGR